MFRMTVEDIFVIRGRGLVATGKVEAGSVRTGDAVTINGGRSVTVDAIEAFRKVLDAADAGMNVGLLFKPLDRDDLKAGDVLSSEGGDVTPHASSDNVSDAARQMGLGG